MLPFPASLFVDVSTLGQDFGGFIQLIILMIGYAYVLYSGSNLISDGSELLLLVPSLAGIVGSIVLPVLGAVPDGAIVLFSGLGPDAQNQLSVGVGALAGSTIMLLTGAVSNTSRNHLNTLCVAEMFEYTGAFTRRLRELPYRSSPRSTPTCTRDVENSAVDLVRSRGPCQSGSRDRARVLRGTPKVHTHRIGVGGTSPHWRQLHAIGGTGRQVNGADEASVYHELFCVVVVGSGVVTWPSGGCAA